MTGKFNKFLKSLDERSREIVLHILRNRHAGIRELSSAISAPNDNYTLMLIREIINPKAGNILGREALVFKESKFDLLTGEKVLFSWWFDEDFTKEKPKTFIDVFDSGDSVRIVADVKIKEDDMRIVAENKRVVIYSNSELRQKINLTHSVGSVTRKSYKNGILELVLAKGL